MVATTAISAAAEDWGRATQPGWGAVFRWVSSRDRRVAAWVHSGSGKEGYHCLVFVACAHQGHKGVCGAEVRLTRATPGGVR